MYANQLSNKKTFHVAIIMDGNGRWATNQNKPRFRGHQAGAERVREIVEAAVKMDIDILTLYAFSSDNWMRPESEVNFLMHLFSMYLKSEIQICLRNNIRLSIIGRRDRLKTSLVRLIEKAEEKTRRGNQLHLRLAIDYSSQYSIVEFLINNIDKFKVQKTQDLMEIMNMPAVEFLIRTGGEQRLSDFLLWECAYAELYFTDIYFPDFSEQDFKEAMNDFNNRDRRFGKITTAVAV